MSETFQRFSRRQRGEHLLTMLLFLALAITGMPQKFHDASWARTAIALMGGVDAARLAHRVAGIAFSIVAVGHVLIVLFEFLTGRCGPSMVPNRQDFKDAITTLRYYLRVSDVQARFDRFDYRQKFEYWGLLLGGFVMVSTGTVLYAPILMTRFLPGELVPIAKVAHSNEGFMAFLVVIVWHIWNAHLAPEVFPFDRSIFTGQVSMEKMHHEHPLELERSHHR